MRLQTLGELHLEVEGKEKCASGKWDKFILSYMAVGEESSYSAQHLSNFMFLREKQDREDSLKDPKDEIYRAIHRLGKCLSKDVIGGGDKNPYLFIRGLLDVDVLNFRDALEEGRWEDAQNLYTGEFLAGQDEQIAKSGDEFEKWVEQQRDTLERQFESAKTLYLAQEEGCNGNFSKASELAKEAYEEVGIERISKKGLVLIYSLLALENDSLAATVQTEAKKKRSILLSIPHDQDIAKAEFQEKWQGSRKNVRSDLSNKGTDATHKAWRVLYDENPNFTGRKELLKKLAANLKKKKNTAIPQVIHGLGGVGKTQIAVSYTYKYQKKYKLVWWIRSEEETILAIDYGKLALELSLTTSVKVEEQIKAIQNWLNTHDKWLLVFDNATDPKIIHRYVPNKHLGHIIITSRNPNWGDIATPLQVRIWTEKESLSFLTNRLSFSLNEKQKINAKELGEELGCLPLALAQAAAYIDNNDQDIEAYLQLFRTQRQELWEDEEAPIHYPRKQLSDDEKEDRAEYTVATTWLIAMEKVRQTEGAKDLLDLCAFLAPDAIPLDIIQEHSEHLPEPLAGILIDPIKQNRVIKILRRYSLIDKAASDIFIHRLVQVVIRDLLTSDQQQKWIGITTKMIRETLPLNPLEKKTREVAGRLISHAEHIAKQAIENESLADLLNRLGRCFQNNALYLQGQVYLERALSIKEKIFGPEHPEVAISLNNLALLFQEQGRYEEAELLYYRALDIKEEEHSDISTSLNNFASLLYLQGKYEEAEPLYCKALKISEKVLGAGHPKVATSLDNLALLFQKQGKYKEAEPLCRRALEIREEKLSAEHPKIATSLNNLASLLYLQGKYKEAEPLYRRTLSITEDVLGMEHPEVATSLNNLALLLQGQGRYEEAEPLCRRALYVKEKVLGVEHSEVATSLSNLVLLLREQGRYKEAEPLCRRALYIKKKALGVEHPEVAIIFHNLALLLHLQERYEEAEPLYRRALDIGEKVLGIEHPEVATSLDNLALLLQKQGRYEEAEPLCRRAMKIRENILGVEHPGVATSLNNLALLLQKRKKYEEAEFLFRRALEILEKTLGTEHPYVATNLHNLSLLLQEQERYEEAGF